MEMRMTLSKEEYMQVAPKRLLSKIVTHMVDADGYSFDVYFDWVMVCSCISKHKTHL